MLYSMSADGPAQELQTCADGLLYPLDACKAISRQTFNGSPPACPALRVELL